MSDVSLTLEAAEKAAAEKGLVVVVPAANELFVDIDSDADHVVFLRHLARLREHYPDLVTSHRIAPSASGGERHHAVVVLSRDVASDLERCFLQAVLGSDRMRELLSWFRIESGLRDHPTVFFEKPSIAPEPFIAPTLLIDTDPITEPS